MSTSFEAIEEYPIPTARAAILSFQRDLNWLSEEQQADSVDEYHEQAKKVFYSSNTWEVFEVVWPYPHHNVYVWNRQGGEGIEFSNLEGQFGHFLSLMAVLLDEYDPDDFHSGR